MKLRIAARVALGFLILICVWALIAPGLATWLIVERRLERADAIMVLSGSSEYKGRTQKAAELYRSGHAPAVYITDDGGRSGWSREDWANVPFVELERRELIANGVPTEAIRVLPDRVAGTIDEARAVAAVADTDQIKTLLVVTSAYHTRRTLYTFEKVLAEKGTQVGIAYSASSVDPNFWWMSRHGWRTVGLEYVKLPAYCLFY